MRLGKVRIAHEYVVDLDNEEMVDHAKVALCEDIYSAMKYNEVDALITVDKNGQGVTESDIPEFLTEEIE